jgi:tetratricopeptide (TPR) repeat protein
MRAIALVSALLLSGCAARQVAPQVRLELDRADALVNDGCHQCLVEALQIYTRVASGRNAPAGASRGALTASVLLVARAKELGLPYTAAMDTARRWAGAQVASPPPAVHTAPQVYLDALELVVGEQSGLMPEERERKNRLRRDAWPDTGENPPAARAALDPVVPTDAVAQYLAIAIDCEEARARKRVDHTQIMLRYPQPLMRFRLALCCIPNLRFTPLREADERWRDTLFFEGRAEMSRFPSPDVGRAVELFDLAHTAFPNSTAVTLALGNARNALEDYAVALALFDSILESEPTHRDALLGRLLSLSYLKRHYDAIRTATEMVTLGMYHMGEAYYWRAWNRYQVHELPSAWADVEEARKLMVNTAVYTLAGFIAYAQRELDTAIDRLDRAYRMDNTNCEAVWTEGMVHVDKQDWEHSSARFTTSVGCFAADAQAAREAIVKLQNSSWSDAVKARRIATAQKRAESSEHRRAQSAYNAASSYLRLGRKVEALGYADIAAEHQLLKEKAIALRSTIEKLP